jgi:hypothetical protein
MEWKLFGRRNRHRASEVKAPVDDRKVIARVFDRKGGELGELRQNRLLKVTDSLEKGFEYIDYLDGSDSDSGLTVIHERDGKFDLDELEFVSTTGSSGSKRWAEIRLDESNRTPDEVGMWVRNDRIDVDWLDLPEWIPAGHPVPGSVSPSAVNTAENAVQRLGIVLDGIVDDGIVSDSSSRPDIQPKETEAVVTFYQAALPELTSKEAIRKLHDQVLGILQDVKVKRASVFDGITLATSEALTQLQANGQAKEIIGSLKSTFNETPLLAAFERLWAEYPESKDWSSTDDLVQYLLPDLRTTIASTRDNLPALRTIESAILKAMEPVPSEEERSIATEARTLTMLTLLDDTRTLLGAANAKQKVQDLLAGSTQKPSSGWEG